MRPEWLLDQACSRRVSCRFRQWFGVRANGIWGTTMDQKALMAIIVGVGPFELFERGGMPHGVL